MGGLVVACVVLGGLVVGGLVVACVVLGGLVVGGLVVGVLVVCGLVVGAVSKSQDNITLIWKIDAINTSKLAYAYYYY